MKFNLTALWKWLLLKLDDTQAVIRGHCTDGNLLPLRKRKVSKLVLKETRKNAYTGPWSIVEIILLKRVQ